MDYPTAIRCYLEMKSGGTLALDVSQLLVEELISSDDFSDDERETIFQKVQEWQVSSEPENSEMMAAIEGILTGKDQFRRELVKFVTHRLNGGSITTF